LREHDGFALEAHHILADGHQHVAESAGLLGELRPTDRPSRRSIEGRRSAETRRSSRCAGSRWGWGCTSSAGHPRRRRDKRRSTGRSLVGRGARERSGGPRSADQRSGRPRTLRVAGRPYPGGRRHRIYRPGRPHDFPPRQPMPHRFPARARGTQRARRRASNRFDTVLQTWAQYGQPPCHPPGGRNRRRPCHIETRLSVRFTVSNDGADLTAARRNVGRPVNRPMARVVPVMGAWCVRAPGGAPREIASSSVALHHQSCRRRCRVLHQRGRRGGRR